MTPRKAPEAVLVALAEAVGEYLRQYNSDNGPVASLEPVEEAHEAYRAAVAPLRTRAEVDAERLSNLNAWREHEISASELAFRDSALCSEPTADETEPEPSWKTTARQRCAAGDHAWSCPGEGKRSACVHCFVYEPNATTDHDADPTLRWRKLVDELRQLLAEAYRGALSIEEKLRSIP